MNIYAVKELILSNELPPLLIFTGKEIGLINLYKNKIQEISKKTFNYYDSCSEFLFGGGRALFDDSINFVFNDKEIITKDSLWNKLERSNTPTILQYESLDKRTKFYTRFKESIVEFDEISVEWLKALYDKTTQLDKKRIDKLCAANLNDYASIELELDKLRVFPKGEQRGLFDIFYGDGTLIKNPSINVFDFVDSVLYGDIKDAFRKLTVLKEQNESSIKLLALLYSGIRNVISLQFSPTKSAEATGLNPYIMKVTLPKVNKYSNIDLLNMLLAIKEIDTGVKTGDIEERLAVDYFLVRGFCGE